MENFGSLILPLLLSALVGYLLGSISFAILLTKAFAHEDVRAHGSGNAGATNVLRVAGKKASALTFLLDFCKCVASVLVGYFLVKHACVANGVDPEMARLGMYAAGFCCMIGHMYPLYFGFRGGKGVVPTAAMMFLLVFLKKRMVSLSSITAAAIYPVVTFCMTYFVDCCVGGLPVLYVVMATLVAALIGATVIIKHRANIKRIRNGTESTISFKKK